MLMLFQLQLQLRTLFKPGSRERPVPIAVNEVKGSCNAPLEFPKGEFLTCTAPADRVQLQWQEVD